MEEEELIENIILNENAYFFIKEESEYLSKKLIKQVFKDASSEKKGHFLLNAVKESHVLDGGEEIFYSIAVFKYEKKPSFIDEEIEGWEETKLAYICILDFANHVVIAKRNVSGINDFLNTLEPMDYNMMTSISAEDDTVYEKATMNNINISDNAIRQKSLEALDLKENLPALGLQGYILNNVRVNNNEDKISLSLNSSRVNKFGSKNNFESFIKWSEKIVEKIIAFVPKINFLSSFATAVDYSKYRKSLNPISILIILSKLYSDYEEGKIDRCFIEFDGRQRELNLIKGVKGFERLLNIEEEGDEPNISFKIKNKIINDLYIALNLKSITLRSRKLAKVFIQFSSGGRVPILQYLNWNKSYLITFDEPELIYCNRKLFKDSRLLGNVDAFLKIFIPYKDLETVTKEKGKFLPTSTKFSSNSIFNFVEDQFLNDYEYFICDDLGREWADHIGLSEESISFFHSKFNKSLFSATAFHDIIGQAQ